MELENSLQNRKTAKNVSGSLLFAESFVQGKRKLHLQTQNGLYIKN